MENIIIQKQDFNVKDVKNVKALIAQPKLTIDEFHKVDGLYYLKDLTRSKSFIDKILIQANKLTVDLVIFPEMSVPEDFIKTIQSFSENTGIVIIGGSHYIKKSNKYFSRCPIIIDGKIYLVEKLNPSPYEKSPIASDGLSPGQNISVFLNSPIGSFGVLICADYLFDFEKKRLLDYGLDFLVVPAFNLNTEMFHSRMNNDCEESEKGLYIIYANTSCDGYASGRSAVFGQIDKMYWEEIQNKGLSDLNPKHKLAELNTNESLLVVEFDLEIKKPFAKHTIKSGPNVKIHPINLSTQSSNEYFTDSINLHDDRYVRIDELFVPPREYQDIIKMLNDSHIVFIIGDPGIGKTYCAIRLLSHYYNFGYKPIYYPGLDKIERELQRKLLTDYRPPNNSIVYFEDPFGRTIFERRDSVMRILGPLIDHIKETNSKIIITSRKEIFDQFIDENPSVIELNKFTAEMNVVKPSYTKEQLIEILLSFNKDVPWRNDDKLLNYAIDKIKIGKLNTPFAIKDFVFSTEHTNSLDILKNRLENREIEEIDLFSDEIQSSTFSTKLVLSLIFLFGEQPRSNLIEWYNNIFNYMNASQTIGGSVPFSKELRNQLGYRLEQYGNRIIAYRFSHPLYEEAFVHAITKDDVIFYVVESLLKHIGQSNLQFVVSRVLNLYRKYPNLCFNLFIEIIPIIKVRDNFNEIVSICLKLIGVYDISANNQQFLEMIEKIITLDYIIRRINEEKDIIVISDGMRLCYNFGRRISRKKQKYKFWQKAVIKNINWVSIQKKWVEEVNFSKLVECFYWVQYFNKTIVTEYFESMTDVDLRRRFTLLKPLERFRLLKLTKGIKATKILRKELLDSYTLYYREDKQKWISEHLVYENSIRIDDGAFEAIRRGYSLLAVGITEILGEFNVGDIVSIINYRNEFVGGGISAYSSEQLRKIQGKHSSMIEPILNWHNGNPVVRASSLTVLREWHNKQINRTP